MEYSYSLLRILLKTYKTIFSKSLIICQSNSLQCNKINMWSFSVMLMAVSSFGMLQQALYKFFISSKQIRCLRNLRIDHWMGCQTKIHLQYNSSRSVQRAESFVLLVPAATSFCLSFANLSPSLKLV